jgi:thiol:disulfide interchange protein DsbA
VAKRKGKAVFRTRLEDRKARASAAAVFLILFSLLTVAAAPAHAAKADLPSFGKGKIEVRLYTDYFCGPCSRMEPRVEALLADLVKRNTVTLIFVDTPIHRFTPLYAKYFLYILNNDRAFPRVLQCRVLLFEAAKGKIETGDKLEEFLREKEVAFTRTDPGPALAALSSLITEDAVRSTPTLITIREGQKGVFVGDTDIVKALEQLQKAGELLKQPESAPQKPAPTSEKQPQ